MKNKVLPSIPSAAIMAATAGCSPNSSGDPAATPPFDLEATNYPSDETSQSLYDELDYQRAVQAYIWAQPLVGQAAMVEGARRLGIEPMELFVFDQLLQPNQKLQTGNDDVVYSFSYFDLRQTGPMVIDVPPKGQFGVILDAWQRPIEDVGPSGPDADAGGKYLIVPPGYQGELRDEGYFVRQSPTNTGMLFLRAVRGRGDTVASAVARLEKTNLYLFSEAVNPPAPRLRMMGHDDYDGLTPHGLDYFDLMAKMVQNEVPAERDRTMLGMLATLGIEPGKPFTPDERMRRILERASDTGRKMVGNFNYNPRDDRPSVFPDTEWRLPAGMTWYTQENGPLTEVDERAALFRYGFSVGKTLDPTANPQVGSGAKYLSTYRDSEGEFLDGGQQYRLHVPANAPMLGYWSTSVYDAEDFSLVDTDEHKPSLSTLKDLAKNPDGSVDLVFGPNAPRDEMRQNWVKTVPGRGFFVLFRLFAPTGDYYKGVWPLEDITKIDT